MKSIYVTALEHSLSQQISIKKILVHAGIEPGPTGWEEGMLPV